MYEYLDNFINNYNLEFNYNKYKNDELEIMNNIIKTNKIIESDNPNILYFIGIYIQYGYKNIMKKYIADAANLNNSDAMIKHVDNLYLSNRKKEGEEYLKKAIELNNSNAITKYANILLEENKINEAKEYYLKAIQLNDSNAMTKYADILLNNHRLEEAKEYYLKAIELKNKDAIYKYALLLEKKFLKYEEAKKYYLKAIEYNNTFALGKYLSFNNSKLQQYKDLSNIKSKITNKILIEMEKDNDVLILKNKMNIFAKNTKMWYLL